MTEWEKFEAAFLQCLKDGVHPGPAEINQRRGMGRYNRLNGKLTSWRRTLMHTHKVPYKKNAPWGKKGEVPSRAY